MTLELRDIGYFVSVAEHGNVGRAAVALGLSQPALSKCLRRLEARLQTRLVRRVPKGIELTAVGTAFLAQVRRIRLSLEDITHEVADLTQGRAGHVRVGCGPDMIDLFVGKACTELQTTAAKATLFVTVGLNDALFHGLRSGDHDFIVSELPSRPYEDLVHEYLADDETVVFASVRHPLARQKSVTLTELAARRWAATTPTSLTRSRLVRAFEGQGLAPPEISLETNSHSLILRMVADSGLLGFLPRRVVEPACSRLGLAALQVKETTWWRRVGVSYRKDAYLSPAALGFIEVLKRIGNSFASVRPSAGATTRRRSPQVQP